MPTTRKMPEPRGDNQLASIKEKRARRVSSSAAPRLRTVCRRAEGIKKKARQRASTTSSIKNPRPGLSSLRNPPFSWESKYWMQRCSCAPVFCAPMMASARRCLNSAYCPGVPFFKARIAAGSAPGVPARSSDRCRSSSRSTVPQAAPPGRPGHVLATVADCSARAAAGSSVLSAFLASLSRSRPVGTWKEAKRAGMSSRTPIIKAASASTVHCTCSAKVTMWAQFSGDSAPTSVSCAYSCSFLSPTCCAKRSSSAQNLSAAAASSRSLPLQGHNSERSS
mmetsp:Transcript_119051/g.332180  ORF Transcript_119051/g.332180 Transcript_119051/m.332180 type:complete len:280 (+) Transcript_119051:175-1014(+)